MAVRTETLGVGIVGIGWCAAQHITAFNHNAHAEVRLLCGRDEGRVRASLERSKVDAPGARITTRFDGRVVEIDTGMQPAYVPDGRASALEIRSGETTAVYADRRDPVAVAGGPHP